MVGRLSLHPTAAALCSTSPAARWSRLGSCVSAYCRTFNKPTKSRCGGRVSISWQAEHCARLLPRQTQRRLRRGGRQAEPAPSRCRAEFDVACGAMVAPWLLRFCALPNLLQTDEIETRWSRLDFYVCSFVFLLHIQKAPGAVRAVPGAWSKFYSSATSLRYSANSSVRPRSQRKEQERYLSRMSRAPIKASTTSSMGTSISLGRMGMPVLAMV